MKNFFFDIDGTLLPAGKDVPESAIKALKWAKEEGHRLFFCTGRSREEVTDNLYKLPFDGGVFSSGAHVQFCDKVIFHAKATDAQRKVFFDAIERFNLLWIIQTEDGSYLTQECLDTYCKYLMEIHHRTLNFSGFNIVSSFPKEKPIVKMFIISPDKKALEARRFMEPVLSTVNNVVGIPETMASEIMIPNLSKSTGIMKMLSYLKEDLDTSVGIGDGDNDIDMIETCAIGISMGNGCENLKKKAKFITSDINSDGIANAIYNVLKEKWTV